MIKVFNVRILRAILLVCFVLSVISCATKAPLPSNITFFEHSPELNSDLAAFHGVWKGKWYSSQDVILIIERVNSDYVELIFSVGYIGAVGILPENVFYYMRANVITNSTIGWATANNNRFVFEMQDGHNKMQGYFIEGSTGAKIPAHLVRTKVEELSDVTIHDYPYVEFNHTFKGSNEFEHDKNYCWKKADKDTILLSTDKKRYKMWEKYNRCMSEEFEWKPKENNSLLDTKRYDYPPKKVILTTDLNENKRPIDEIDIIDLNTKGFYVFTHLSDIALSAHVYHIAIYDDSGKRLFTDSMYFVPSEPDWNLWSKVKIQKWMKPGQWSVKIHLGNELIVNKKFKATYNGVNL